MPRYRDDAVKQALERCDLRFAAGTGFLLNEVSDVGAVCRFVGDCGVCDEVVSVAWAEPDSGYVFYRPGAGAFVD